MFGIWVLTMVSKGMNFVVFASIDEEIQLLQLKLTMEAAMVISVEFAAEGLCLHERFECFSESLPSALALCFLDFRPQLLALQAAGEASGRRVLHFGGRGKAMLFEGTWREIRQMAKRAAFWVLLITEDRQVTG